MDITQYELNKCANIAKTTGRTLKDIVHKAIARRGPRMEQAINNREMLMDQFKTLNPGKRIADLPGESQEYWRTAIQSARKDEMVRRRLFEKAYTHPTISQNPLHHASEGLV